MLELSKKLSKNEGAHKELQIYRGRDLENIETRNKYTSITNKLKEKNKHEQSKFI